MTELPVNPFRPGAGHMPPYLAGRKKEIEEFQRLLQQSLIMENLLLTGLRGVGKTVLLDSLKPYATASDWMWIGTNISESSTVSEERIALRILTDLSVITSGVCIKRKVRQELNFIPTTHSEDEYLSFDFLVSLYEGTPGLNYDKLKKVLEVAWQCLSEQTKVRGVIFAYDESQNLADHERKEEYPLAMILDVFQSIQKQQIPFMLALAGLPTLQTKLVEARTYSERMFHVVFLTQLSREETRKAITKPIADVRSKVQFTPESVEMIADASAGYPYFIQFICKEAFDCFLSGNFKVPIPDITRKLDADFFAGRWGKATDRQRELLKIIASLPGNPTEFTVQEIREMSQAKSTKPFSASHINQMLAALINSGLVYKNRYGKYSLAVPLLADFINRQSDIPQTHQQTLFE